MRYVALLLCSTAFAQQYEVATVKVSEAGNNLAFLANPRAPTFSVRNAPLFDLLTMAYQTSQISGPDWLSTARYDIVAKAPEGADPADGPARLRALLEERFQIKAHRENGERNVYALEVTGGGAKIAPYDPDKKIERFPEGASVVLLRGTMSKWSDTLGKMVGRPVIDRTGIQGGDYYHLLTYGEGVDSTVPGIFTSLPEQTGLRLRSTRAEMEIVVIDSANRIPTEN